jgi:lysylphosphatidylglycerol synthetase-like protein (DUF2156 family)
MHSLMYTKFGIMLFSLAIITGQLYTVENYSILSHTISELGAQETKNNFIAILGFIAFGSGIILEWIRYPSRAGIPFLFFGIFIALAGLLPHKPIDPNLSYSVIADQLHSLMASLSGIALTIGFFWNGIFARTARMQALNFYMASICLTLPLIMFAIPEYQGIIQRLMYFQVFVWLWFFYPKQ